ncbi:MAG: hypothetical protein A4E53_00930 [Pelotomaculum sp. PtaB.Bin104]|nr:MAG: hypothetical protein A4E53_00930 [Pelotomaculum sp. PtaB.Bin104]
MLRIVKKMMYSPLVMLALFVAASAGDKFSPTSIFMLYQPKPPVR